MIMAIINTADLFSIKEAILKRVNKELTYHGMETAYIVYKILNKLNYSEKEIYKITSLAFLHDIGAYKTDINTDIKQYHITDTTNHSIYGYELLKHINLFKEDSSMILYHHHSYSDRHILINDIEIKDESFLISLGDVTSLAFNLFNYDENKIINYIKSMDKSRFKKIYYDTLIELVDDGLISEMLAGKYKKHFLRKFSAHRRISKDRMEKYIILLPLAIDFFSFETSIHTVGVYCITKKLCEKLNINLEDSKTIEVGALLHDLGKVCIPKNILEKKDKLTKEEFEVMKKHVVYTKEILEDAGINKEIINLACSHHEKLDGGGYPQRLSDSSLSVGDRIITVADIFCALTEKRHYKNAFSKQKVVSIFYDMVSHNQIDKTIVEILIDNYDEILDYMTVNRNKFKEVLDNMLKDYEKISQKWYD